MRCRAIGAAVVAAAAVAATTSTAPAKAEPPPGGGGDTTRPTIGIDIPPSPWEGWYPGPVTMTLSATDDDFVEKISYQLTGAQTGSGNTIGGTPIEVVISAPGVTTVNIRAEDPSGNVAQRTYGVGIDLTDPTVGTGGTAEDGRPIYLDEVRTLVFVCADAQIEVASCTARYGTTPFTSGSAIPVSETGKHTIIITAADRVGRTRDVPFTYSVGLRSLDVTATPTITTDDGAAAPTSIEVGARLHAAGGAFSPEATETTYTWFANGTQVATGPVYTADPSHRGKWISVRAVGSRSRFATTTTSDVGAVLVYQRLKSTEDPVIVGNPETVRPGDVLVAEGGTFAPAADSITYQWRVDGVTIATSPTYQVAATDVGKQISMFAIGLRDGYSATQSGFVGSVRVRSGQLQVHGSPSVTGTAVEGGTLQAGAGATVTPAPGNTDTLWTVGSRQVIAPRITLTGADVGQQVTCRQVYRLPGYTNAEAPCRFGGGTTTLTVTGRAWSVLAPVALKGKARVGKRLRVVLPPLSGTAGAWAYQWLRNGKPIARATGASYKLKKADARRRISVRVTATTPHRPDTISVSAPKRIRR